MRLSATKTGAANQYRGFGTQLWDLAGSRPSLDLNFADNKSLVDGTTGKNLVTFTRASSGTYVDSQGVIRTATTNLILRSEEFNTTWTTQFSATVTADQVAAPNGLNTADLLVISSSNRFSGVRQIFTFLPNTTYTFSVWARAVSGTAGFALKIYDGVADTFSQNLTATETWQRYSLTLTTAAGAGAGNLQVANQSSPLLTQNLYIWGAQLEQSSTVGEYIPTTSTINSAPRFDHDPTTGESLGLLVEEQRTNLLLNSEDFGTTWGLIDGLQLSSNQMVAPDGSATADLLSGGGAAAGYLIQAGAPSNQFTSGTTYTFSIYLKKANTSTVSTLLYGSTFNSAGSNPVATWNLDTGIPSFTNGVTGSMTPVGNGWYRCVATDTATATETKNQQWLRMPPLSGAVYAWGAQLEAGSSPTSYIPTTSATVTRAADVASITGSNFSSWYNQTEGTAYINLDTTNWNAVNNFNKGFTIGSDDNNGWWVGTSATDNTYRYRVRSGGVTQFGPGDVARSNTVNNKVALAVKSSNFAIAADGGNLVSSNTGIVPAVNQLRIGDDFLPGYQANQCIRRLTYWPTRLSDTTLQAITT